MSRFVVVLQLSFFGVANAAPNCGVIKDSYTEGTCCGKDALDQPTYTDDVAGFLARADVTNVRLTKRAVFRDKQIGTLVWLEQHGPDEFLWTETSYATQMPINKMYFKANTMVGMKSGFDFSDFSWATPDPNFITIPYSEKAALANQQFGADLVGYFLPRNKTRITGHAAEPVGVLSLDASEICVDYTAWIDFVDDDGNNLERYWVKYPNGTIAYDASHNWCFKKQSPEEIALIPDAPTFYPPSVGRPVIRGPIGYAL